MEPQTEADQGFIDAFRGKRLQNQGREYFDGYADGYNAYLRRTGRQSVNKTFFILGYQDAVQKRNQLVQHPDYVKAYTEGYALGVSDNKKPNHRKLQGFLSVEVSLLKPQQAEEYAPTSTNQGTNEKTLDDYFYAERDVLLWKLTNTC